MQTAPYHSKNASRSDSYHEYPDCIVGRQIPVPDRQEGENYLPLCKICADR